MRILLTSEFFHSGQTTHVLDLAKQLVILGHDTAILFTAIHVPDFSSRYRPWLRQHGIRCFVSPQPTQIFSILREIKPEIMHSHSSTIFDLTRQFAAIRRIPYVVTCHGLGFEHPKYREALDGAAQIIAVGKNSLAQLLPRYRAKAIIIPNGVDTSHFIPGEKGDKLKLVYLGRLDWSKVPMLKFLHQVVQEIPELDWEVVGSWQPPIPDLNFRPWQPDPAPILAPAHFMAGCGRSAREAMSSGCVVLLVNQRYDGIITPELVSNPNFDFSGNKGHFPITRLAADLRYLVDNPEVREQLSQFSRTYAEEHLSSLDMARKVVEVYQKALESYPSQ